MNYEKEAMDSLAEHDEETEIFIHSYDGVPCDEWPLAKSSKGYGIRKFNKVVWLVHRLEWTLKVGPIPDDLCVLHHCDNPPCKEIKHLFLGTRRDNADDMVSKGRSPNNKGESNPNCKLTFEQVSEIRELYATCDFTMQDLGKVYGISFQQVSNLINFNQRNGS